MDLLIASLASHPGDPSLSPAVGIPVQPATAPPADVSCFSGLKGY
jgi:hypothetical protein